MGHGGFGAIYKGFLEAREKLVYMVNHGFL
jgi:hypothetical protein